MTASNEKGVSDFMSTHPSDEKRIARLKEVAPVAMQYYKTGVTPTVK